MNGVTRRNRVRARRSGGLGVVCFGGICAIAACFGGVCGADAAPNILLILSDDHALRTISAYAGEAGVNRTPNIDRLADEGAVFTRSFPTSAT